MAKYSRFDPRNKKRGKHKNQTLNKDNRIREDQKSYLKDFNVDIKQQVVYANDILADSLIEE